MKIQVEVFWVMTPSCEDGGSMDLRNVGKLPQHHSASQPRIRRSESPSQFNHHLFLRFSFHSYKLHAHPIV